jgi:hypothetical protein
MGKKINNNYQHDAVIEKINNKQQKTTAAAAASSFNKESY